MRLFARLVLVVFVTVWTGLSGLAAAADPLRLPPGEMEAAVRPVIRETCRRTGLDRLGFDEDLFAELIRRESGFRWNARSPKNAVGLCQFIPDTARRWGLAVDPARGVDDRLDPVASIRAAGGYLAFLLNLFGGDARLALAAYNAGEGRVVSSGYRVPNIRETENYVAAILAGYRRNAGRFRAVPTGDARIADPEGERESEEARERRAAAEELEAELRGKPSVTVISR